MSRARLYICGDHKDLEGSESDCRRDDNDQPVGQVSNLQDSSNKKAVKAPSTAACM